MRTENNKETYQEAIYLNELFDMGKRGMPRQYIQEQFVHYRSFGNNKRFSLHRATEDWLEYMRGGCQ